MSRSTAGYIIVLAAYEGSQQALLYRRNLSNGQWVFRRVLETYSGPYVRSDVAMKNGIAAVQFGDEVSLFEISGGDYVRASSTAPIRHQGGLAISGNRVLIGGNDCDYDAVIYQKNTAGSWAITGRIDDNQGECLGATDLTSVETQLRLRDARLEESANGMHAWRRNGTAVDWVPAGRSPCARRARLRQSALQGATAVAPHGDRLATQRQPARGRARARPSASTGRRRPRRVPLSQPCTAMACSSRPIRRHLLAAVSARLHRSVARPVRARGEPVQRNGTGATRTMSPAAPPWWPPRDLGYLPPAGARVHAALAAARARAGGERFRGPRRFRLHVQRSASSRSPRAGPTMCSRRVPPTASPSRHSTAPTGPTISESKPTSRPASVARVVGWAWWRAMSMPITTTTWPFAPDTVRHLQARERRRYAAVRKQLLQHHDADLPCRRCAVDRQPDRRGFQLPARTDRDRQLAHARARRAWPPGSRARISMTCTCAHRLGYWLFARDSGLRRHRLPERPR